jgi:hypothetical protein
LQGVEKVYRRALISKTRNGLYFAHFYRNSASFRNNFHSARSLANSAIKVTLTTSTSSTHREHDCAASDAQLAHRASGSDSPLAP